MKTSRTISHYITNRLGSMRYVLISSGSIFQNYTYSPFRQVHSSSGSLSQPYQYVGGEFYYAEDTTGLQLLGQRWYDSEVGRFISRDPIGEEGGLNLYVYVNPINDLDPEGKTAQEVVRDCKLGCDVYLSGPKLLTECCSSINEYVLEEVPKINRVHLKECYQECCTQNSNKPGAVISKFLNCLATKIMKEALIKLFEKILLNTI